MSSFQNLWLAILDFMERFINAASSDLLADAVPESLKNMLLVMDTAGIFFVEAADNGEKSTSPIWSQTQEKLHSFLPDLMSDLFGERHKQVKADERPACVTKAVEIQPTVEVAKEEEPKPEEPKPELRPAPEREAPPASPVDPPVVNPAFFAQEDIGKPKLSMVNIPPPPKIDPMPPPPAGIQPIVLRQPNFQPIQTAAPTSGGTGVPLVTPRPVMHNDFAASPLSSYFTSPSAPSSTAPGATNNLLTAAFTPTIGAASSTVFLGDPTQSNIVSESVKK